MSLLNIAGLTAGYGRAVVLRDVDLSVEDGEAVALVGRNGAGKSTLLNSVFGLARVHAGEITVSGRPLRPDRGGRAAAHGLALTPQGRRIVPQLTVKENLLLGTAARRSGRWTLETVFELFPVLAERSSARGSVLSGGQQQMLAIGRSLMANPDVLFLDEPSEGLAPVVVDDLVDVFRAIHRSGTAVVLVEQQLELVRQIADRVLVLSKGAIKAQAPISQLETGTLQDALAL
jgi:ABC-type branched-subunit amino acid transport system ATPase component